MGSVQGRVEPRRLRVYDRLVLTMPVQFNSVSELVRVQELTQTERQPFKRISKWHRLSNQHREEFSPAKSNPETHVGELQCLKNHLSQVRDEPIGHKASKIFFKKVFMAQINFQTRSPKEYGVESAQSRQESSSDTRQSITQSQFPEVPPPASSAGCKPHHHYHLPPLCSYRSPDIQEYLTMKVKQVKHQLPNQWKKVQWNCKGLPQKKNKIKKGTTKHLKSARCSAAVHSRHKQKQWRNWKDWSATETQRGQGNASWNGRKKRQQLGKEWKERAIRWKETQDKVGVRRGSRQMIKRKILSRRWTHFLMHYVKFLRYFMCEHTVTGRIAITAVSKLWG